MSPSGTRASCSRAATTSMSAGSWARSFRGLSALSGFSAMPPAPTLFLLPPPADGGAAGGLLALHLLLAPIPLVYAVHPRLPLLAPPPPPLPAPLPHLAPLALSPFPLLPHLFLFFFLFFFFFFFF